MTYCGQHWVVKEKKITGVTYQVLNATVNDDYVLTNIYLFILFT